MIISASRRTDIPAYYTDWFMRRLQDKKVWVRNPVNPKMVSEVDISPQAVDGIVLWTKDPRPMLPRLGELGAYPYYFQYTVNAYGADVEAHIAPLQKRLDTFRALAEKTGPKRVIWRYNPIVLSGKYSAAFHAEMFGNVARTLAGYTKTCMIAFVDFYQTTVRHTKGLGLEGPDVARKVEVAKMLEGIAEENGISIEACCEPPELDAAGIPRAVCVDKRIFEQQTGAPYKAGKDKNQRPECACHQSVDIGAYQTCPAGCVYCYANHSEKLLLENRRLYSEKSPLLCGELQQNDIVKKREAKSIVGGQLRMKL